MRTKKLIPILLGLAVSLWLSAPAKAAEEKAQMPENAKAMMEKAKEAGTPGAGHAVLKGLEGDWNVTTRMWMKPGDKPEESKGTSSMSWILDGRFLKQDFKGNWMGQPFQGQGIVGYDNVKKEYNSVWLDSMATGMMKGTGQYDKGSKTIKETGTYSCPIEGKEMNYRAEWKISGKDKQVYSMFMTGPDSKEYKSMEITYTRAK